MASKDCKTESGTKGDGDATINTPELVQARHTIADLNRWPIFSNLSCDMLASVKKVLMFIHGNKIIFVTVDDDVYAVGLGDFKNSFQPRKIHELSKKHVIDITCGDGHTVALTKDGKVYSWGQNQNYQLGDGSNHSKDSPAKVGSLLDNKVIIKIACGCNFTLALSADGEVFTWGFQIAKGINEPSPQKITEIIGTRKTIAIACGSNFSMALMDNGEVYGWGVNNSGQLGIGSVAAARDPTRVAFNNVIVTQIVCGQNHALALSHDGNLFAWGDNSKGQLGTGNTTNMMSPTSVINLGEKFIEVSANHQSNMSAAMTQSGKVFIWGLCRQQAITEPCCIKLLSTDEAFHSFSTPIISWRTYNIEMIQGPRVSEVISYAFDNPEHSDINFLVENKKLYVHKTILKLRCEYFRSMFQGEWDETETESVKISQFSYKVYKAFLKYLYTDVLDLEWEDAIDLLDLANAYLEDGLKLKCEAILEQGVSKDNVAMLYCAGLKFDAKSLTDFCIQFAQCCLSDVTKTEAFRKGEDKVMKDFIVKVVQAADF